VLGSLLDFLDLSWIVLVTLLGVVDLSWQACVGLTHPVLVCVGLFLLGVVDLSGSCGRMFADVGVCLGSKGILGSLDFSNLSSLSHPLLVSVGLSWVFLTSVTWSLLGSPVVSRFSWGSLVTLGLIWYLLDSLMLS
jgi:hypothetical protein